MKAWMTYLCILGLCCAACPPLLGFVLGVGTFYCLYWVTYKAVGG
jgi:hypothetical protein